MIYYSTNNNYSSDNLLVCIPGIGTNHALFSEFILELNNINLFIISPDLRGCGKSIDMDGEFSINEAVEDIKEILNSHKNYNVVLLGYSQGGNVAQLFAKKYPDQISGLLLCNTFAKNPVTPIEIIEAFVFKFILQFFGLKTASNLLVFKLKNDLSVERIEEFKQMLRDNKKKAIVSYLIQLRKFDSRAWLKCIHKPCLIIQGRNDVAVSINQTNVLSYSIPNSKTIFINNAGHMMIWSHTKQLARIVCDYYLLHAGAV